jgi:hypothetical protein
VKSLLPLSIVVAGALVATGIYLGLRSMRPSSAPIPAPTSEGEAGPSPAAQDATSVRHALALRAATEAVDQALPQWRFECWDTAAPSTRRPGRYVAALAFGPDGATVVAGITEDRGGSDPNVAQCLRQRVHLLRIPPPRQSISLEVPFALP